MKSNRLNIVDRIVSEEIKKRIASLKNKIVENKDMKKEICSECGGGMMEGECNECGYMKENKGMCSECGEGTMVEGECSECGYSEGEFKESKKLSKGQQYIARQASPKNKIDAKDFAKLRAKKTETKEGKKFPDLSGDGKVTRKDILLGRGVKLKENNVMYKITLDESTNETFYFKENEVIDIIENIVNEEKKKDKKSTKTLNVTKSAQNKTKKENDDYTQDVVKKMKDYMKDMYMGGKGYEANPDDFPQSNYDMEKEHNEMKYHPSDAVEEYIEAFAYPGMTNLVYDEIKPEDKNIEKQIKGDSKNGNAVTGKDGKALGNVSKRSQKTGERFKKNFDENLYGAEQQKASYKRQPQPVDVAGDGKLSGSLKSKKGSSDESKQGADKTSSINKATKILNTLESTEDKATKIIKEDLQKMMNLISYDRKTQ